MTLSEAIKAIRQERGMNQQQFAELIGVSQPCASQYEAGKRVPAFQTLAKMRKHGIDINLLFDGIIDT